MHNADDKSLMLRFQEEGDALAFHELFRRHKVSLYRFLLKLSANESIVEDVSQHTWLRLIELSEAGRYRAEPAASFQTFLFTLARNHYFDEYHRRHEAVRTESLETMPEGLAELADDEAVNPEIHIAEAQDKDIIARALRGLPAEQREVLALWMEGFELVEVAKITGAPWHTIVSRKRYGLAKLRLALSASVVG